MISEQNRVALVVGFSYFLVNLDSTILTTALPQIAESLGSDPVHLSIVITGYLVSLAVCIPVSSWLADRYGTRTIFKSGLLLFIVTSALCALANSVITLAIARIVQGMSVAVMVPVGRTVLMRTVKKSEFVKATAFLSVPAQFGSVIGPAIGGLITAYASWRWIFLVNIPIGVLGLFYAQVIGEFREGEKRTFDWIGFVLIAISLGAVLYALEAIGRGYVPLWIVSAVFFGGVACGVVAIRHTNRTIFPLMDLTVLRLATFAANAWGGTLFRVGWGALPFLLPLMFQLLFGMDAFTSGLLLLANALGSVTSRILGPAAIAYFGFRKLLIWNGVIASASMAVCGFLTPNMGFPLIMLVLFIGGILQSLEVTALNTIAYSDVEERQMSSASAISNLMQQLGKAFGVAISALVLNLALAYRGAIDLEAMDFVLAFAAISAVSLAAVPLFLTLKPDAGAQVSGHQIIRKTDDDVV